MEWPPTALYKRRSDNAGIPAELRETVQPYAARRWLAGRDRLEAALKDAQWRRPPTPCGVLVLKSRSRTLWRALRGTVRLRKPSTIGPELDERPIFAVDRILRRPADIGDLSARLLEIDLARPRLVEGAAGCWIGPDDQKIGARGDAAMARTGGQHRDVAGLDVERLALVAAEFDASRSARDAQHFVVRVWKCRNG